ncbi:divalent-cation tolerance protein CutA [Corticibacter populi]|nr:divalent-cation tolerance protein CutA [Corticibacter populi]RZS35763.1 periplasmic divalent cation tolerance protein [Corticibacter populi]
MHFLTVLTTVATQADAERLASGAIAQRLAACAQFEPIQSCYVWQGGVVQEGEYRLLFKTSDAGYAALQTWLLAQHPYELPAIYALATQYAHAPFAAWVADSVADAGSSQ